VEIVESKFDSSSSNTVFIFSGGVVDSAGEIMDDDNNTSNRRGVVLRRIKGDRLVVMSFDGWMMMLFKLQTHTVFFFFFLKLVNFQNKVDLVKLRKRLVWIFFFLDIYIHSSCYIILIINNFKMFWKKFTMLFIVYLNIRVFDF